MDIFFGKMGITDLKYKPAYNPYTEPSMEIFSYRTCLDPQRFKNVFFTDTPVQTRASASWSRLATVACSARKCWRRWVCRKLTRRTQGLEIVTAC